MTEEKEYSLLLGKDCKLRAEATRRLLAEYGTAKEVFKAPEREIERLDYLNEKEKSQILEGKKRGPDRITSELMERAGINIVTWEEKEYPIGMREIIDRPYLLYYKGALPKEGEKSVAIIGARQCSDYGRRMAERFGEGLAKEGVTVISGMASGIDGIAQNAALEAGGRSIGVLGCGVDVCYPASNRKLYTDLSKKGGLISEYEPGRRPIAGQFPRRNRLISALADLVLVIEAREKSGTFITVDFALEQGREVYALPGRVEDNLSIGCNRLIRDGAGIATCVEDVLLALGIEADACKTGMVRVIESGMEDRKQIIRILLEGAKNIDELYVLLNGEYETIQELMVEMMRMEMEGIVCCIGGVYSVK